MAKGRRSTSNSSESFAKFDPDTCSWKTPQCSSTGDSTSFSGKWPSSGLMLRGQCYQRQIAGPIISGSGSGFWPTPLASESTHGGPNQRDSAGRPGLTAAVHQWPTASARDWKDTPGMAKTSTDKDGSHRNRNDQLARAVYVEDQVPAKGGTLNADWVEWLMGWPLGWTAITWSARTGGKKNRKSPASQSASSAGPIDSKLSVTDRFLEWQLLHGRFLSERFGIPGWRPVVFAADCDDDLCPCGRDYAEECVNPGPTEDGFEYVEIHGRLYGKGM